MTIIRVSIWVRVRVRVLIGQCSVKFNIGVRFSSRVVYGSVRVG